MGRKMGRTVRRQKLLVAVPAAAVRVIKSRRDLRPGEVAALITPRRARVQLPSAVTLEVWRLRQHDRTFGQIEIALADKLPTNPNSRRTTVRRHAQVLQKFWQTTAGQALRASAWWSDWLASGVVDPLI